MRIADNIVMLELNCELANGPGVINPLMIWDDRDVVLFDAGLPDMGTAIREAAERAGVPIERLNKVMITHSDMDHIGSLSQIIHESEGKIAIFAHKEEKPYIECELPPVRVKQMEERIDLTSGAMREQLVRMTEGLKKNYHMFKAKVDKTVEDGEVLPVCGGITCIFTPGHTPGHMSYYFEKSRLLVAGDILQINDGTISRGPNFTTVDEKALEESLKKLSNYEIKSVVCYHGGLFQGDVTAKIAEML